jgi:uncharacterized protein
MSIVSDTSPLIALAKINAMDLLEKLFQRVLVPQQVKCEFEKNCSPAEERCFRDACTSFLEIVEIDAALPLTRQLDAGEHDAIALAVKLRLPILIDDRKGSNEAKEQKLIAISTRAVLKFAESKRLIPSSKQLEIAMFRNNYFLPSY